VKKRADFVRLLPRGALGSGWGGKLLPRGALGKKGG